MDYRRVQRSLRLITKTYARILDRPAQNLWLPSAIGSVESTRKRYDYAVHNQPRGFTPEPWGYTIGHDQPVRFVPTEVNGINLQVDIYCDIRWIEAEVPVVQDIKVRVWSTHARTIFEPERDADNINDVLRDPGRTAVGRVISRFHFDKANRGQPGPEFHLQIGGKAEPYELCWHPESVKVPRLAHPPLELFLACQLVAANFFPREYAEIKQRSEWLGELRWQQASLLRDHYQRCLNAIDAKESLLDALWMT